MRAVRANPHFITPEALLSMHLAELKAKSPSDLLSFAESLQIENASSLRKQDMMFAILKNLAENDQAIQGDGTLEILPDGFAFLRSPESNFLPGPDDIYVSPAQVRRYALRTGDTVEGQIRAPKDGERYFALLKLENVNFEPPEAVRHRINFDNLTPLYPDRRLKMEMENFQSVAKGSAEGQHAAGDRSGRAHRHGAARVDRRPSAHRQDGDAAEYRHRHFDQPPRSLPDGAADR